MYIFVFKNSCVPIPPNVIYYVHNNICNYDICLFNDCFYALLEIELSIFVEPDNKLRTNPNLNNFNAQHEVVVLKKELIK